MIARLQVIPLGPGENEDGHLMLLEQGFCGGYGWRASGRCGKPAIWLWRFAKTLANWIREQILRQLTEVRGPIGGGF